MARMTVQQTVVASALGLGLVGCGGEGAVKAAAGAAGSLVQGAEAATPAEAARQVQPGVKVKTLDAAVEKEAPAPERAETGVSPGVRVKTLDATIPEDK